MEVTRTELDEQKDSSILRDFLSSSNSLINAVVKDAKTAQTAEQENKQRRRDSVGGDTSKETTVLDASKTESREPVMLRLAQMELITELKGRQVSPLMREGKDGAIEDIITVLKAVPFTARSGKRSSRMLSDFNDLSPS
ncbi:Formin-like protein 1 [Bagarius yarrelli]|uniref:Formin-like protein 1 n=1 Tax=Bagarius yarrelli TaxID=175774 RepID=A0A556U1I5_BAGYA|nr:Formin-like protein 1 [Bagarius yarrelli]